MELERILETILVLDVVCMSDGTEMTEAWLKEIEGLMDALSPGALGAALEVAAWMENNGEELIAAVRAARKAAEEMRRKRDAEKAYNDKLDSWGLPALMMRADHAEAQVTALQDKVKGLQTQLSGTRGVLEQYKYQMSLTPMVKALQAVREAATVIEQYVETVKEYAPEAMLVVYIPGVYGPDHVVTTPFTIEVYLRKEYDNMRRALDAYAVVEET